jgi:NADH-quinone oxidoreductase subunit F
MIDKYVRGQPMVREYDFIRPSEYVAPVEMTEEEAEQAERPETHWLPADQRKNSFAEVELSLSEEEAVREAKRCLRCDLQTQDAKQQLAQMAGQQAEGGCGCG